MRILQNKHVFTPYGNDTEYFHSINYAVNLLHGILDGLLHYSTHCHALWFKILCYVLFPRCIPSKITAGNLSIQSICKDTCIYLHTSSCSTFVAALLQVLRRERWRLNDKDLAALFSILEMKCERYPSQYALNVPECLSVFGKKQQ